MNCFARAAARHLQRELCSAVSAGTNRVCTGLQGFQQRCFQSSRLSFTGGKQIQTDVEAKLTERFQSDKGKLLFKKVLEGHHQPPIEADTAARKATGAAAGAQPASRIFEYVSNFFFYGSLAAGATFMGSYAVYSDEQLHVVVDGLRAEEGPVAAGQLMFLERLAWARDFYKTKTAEFTDPPTDHLLPDLHPHYVQHHLRTLVLDLDEVLVHSEWTRQVGWKTFKRPGASDFLEVLSACYEIVVFTNENNTYADPLLNRIDPGIISNQGPVIAYRLYKNACQYEKGEYRRDLSKLNRDMSRVIFLTTKKRADTCMQPENMIVIDDWEEMDPADTTLLDIVPMLQLIVQRDVADTRTVCKAYEGTDVVATFRQRMASALPQKASAPTKRHGMFSLR